jgi:hypothetical protein
MAVAVETSGTQTATIGTEHSLGTPSTAKTRVLQVDLNALLADEVVELIIEEKAVTAGTVRKYLIESFTGGRTDPVVKTTPSAQPFGGTFKLKQVNGTGRAFDWAIVTLD